ncbi:MAG: HEAT repeat domain-containing protein [bacterium]|nr:HEAT repeat domain-containing protein [bacterium]
MFQKKSKIRVIIVLLFLVMFMFPAFQAVAKSPKLDFETMVKKIRSLNMPLEKAERYLHSYICGTCLESKGILKKLVDALNDDDVNVRWAVVTALRHIADSASRPFLEKRLNIEPHKSIRRKIEATLKNLQYDKENGTARYRNGEKNPRITFIDSAVKQPDRWLSPISGPVVRVSDILDIRQAVDSNTYYHLVQPFTGATVSMETQKYVFAVCVDHLNVFFKQENYWRIYTSADGYLPLCGREVVRLDNLEKHMAIVSKKYNSYVWGGPIKCPFVTLFNKKTGQITGMPADAYPAFRASCKSVPPLAHTTGWQVSQNEPAYIRKLVYKSPGTGQSESLEKFPGGLNNIKLLCPVGNDYMVAATDWGVRIFKEDTEIKRLDITNGLHSHEVKKICAYKNRFMLFYKGNIDLFEIAGQDGGQTDIRLVKRIPHKTRARFLGFNDTYIFCADDSSINTISLKNYQGVVAYSIQKKIRNIRVIPRGVMVETDVGFATLTLPEKKMTYFFGLTRGKRKTLELKPETRPSKITWHGEVDGYLVGTCRQSDRYDITNWYPVFFHLESNRLVSKANVTSRAALNTASLSSPIVTAQKHLCLIKNTNRKNQKNHKKQTDHYEIVNINKSKKTVKAFVLKKGIRDSRFQGLPLETVTSPTGKKLNHSVLIKNVLWIHTDTGLFSYNIAKKYWRSHYYPGSRLSANSALALAVTGKYIFGSDFNISRETLKKSFSGEKYRTLFSGFWKDGKEFVVFSTKRELGCYEPAAGREKRIPLPEHFDTIVVKEKQNKIYGVGKKALYQFNRHLRLQRKYQWHDDSKERTAAGLAVIGKTAWISAFKKLIRIDLSSGQKKTFALTFNASEEPLYIFADRKAGHLWLISNYTDNAWLFNVKNGEALSLTSHLDLEDNKGKTIYIESFLEDGASFLIGGHKRVYRLDKKNLQLRRSSLRFDSDIEAIAKQDDSFFFVSKSGGIYKVNRAILQESLK